MRSEAGSANFLLDAVLGGVGAGVSLANRMSGGMADEVLDRVLASRRLQDLTDRVLESPFYDHLVDRLLETDALWQLVDRIAKSPEVIEAVTAGSASLGRDVADEVRGRGIAADDAVERIARRLVRRPRG